MTFVQQKRSKQKVKLNTDVEVPIPGLNGKMDGRNKIK
jgi:hypothetical protein